jgi:PAS domain S-box-containing protein
MSETDISYTLLAGFSIVLLTLLPTLALRVDFKSSGKPYLGWAFLAGLIAMAGQVPDGLLGINPDSGGYYLASSFFQFLASLVFFVALLRLEGELRKQEKTVLAVLAISWVCAAAYLLMVGQPQTIVLWYFVSAPIILVTLLIFLQLFRVSLKSSTSQILLLISSFALLSLRAIIPVASSIELVYLIYFLQLMLFPVLLTALHLSEVQTTHEKIKSLLRRRIQSEANVQFILDNSMDVIVAVNSAGLLTTWNKVAEVKFGYTAEQAIGKVHIDDFFIDHYCHSDSLDYREFDAWMENASGETIAVRVRLKTIHESGRNYTIYMLRDFSAIGEMGKSQIEFEKERADKKRLSP